MKTLISFLIIFLVTPAMAVPPVYDADLLGAFKKARTVQELAAGVEDFLSAPSIKFVKEKLKGQKPVRWCAAVCGARWITLENAA